MYAAFQAGPDFDRHVERGRERGRQFFYGPPDEELAARLRERGVID